MKKIFNKKQLETTVVLPLEVKKEIEQVLETLNEYYGEHRDFEKDLGGYVILIESKDQLKELEAVRIDIDSIIAEYVDKIICSNGEVYTNSLIICNPDYTISLIIPMELTPQNLKDYMID